MKIRTDPEAPGQRLDVFISGAAEGVSRSYAEKLIGEGRVLVNGKREKPSYRIRGGEEIELDLPEVRPLELEPEDIPLDIVYEDSDILILNKPRGLVVHPADGHDTGTLVQALLHHCGDLSGIGGVLRPGIVHRIDKDTTGLLAVAKNDAAHLSLSRQLEDHTMHRLYLALVEGRIHEDGFVDAPIGRSPRDRKKMAVVADGKPAYTSYRVLENFAAETLVECSLRTGRTHQIRVHMASISHPVVGDTVYGFRKQRYNLDGQMLHAHTLILKHPSSGEEMTFRADPPEDFRKLLEILRKKG